MGVNLLINGGQGQNRTADTDIQKIITQRVKAGECRCEETNPSGGCCLGNVSKAIKHARALKDQGLL